MTQMSKGPLDPYKIPKGMFSLRLKAHFLFPIILFYRAKASTNNVPRRLQFQLWPLVEVRTRQVLRGSGQIRKELERYRYIGIDPLSLSLSHASAYRFRRAPLSRSAPTPKSTSRSRKECPPPCLPIPPRSTPPARRRRKMYALPRSSPSL